MRLDRDRIISLILGPAFVFALYEISNCTSKQKQTETLELTEYSDEIVEDDSFESVSEIAVCLDNGVAIIIPVYDVSDYLSDFVQINTGNNLDSFPKDKIVFFHDGDISSYDKAFNYAISMTDTVYLYEDVIAGNPVNIALENKIEREMGI